MKISISGIDECVSEQKVGKKDGSRCQRLIKETTLKVEKNKDGFSEQCRPGFYTCLLYSPRVNGGQNNGVLHWLTRDLIT